jgi:hypothetical protein
MPNKDAIESLQAFAATHHEYGFVHLCTAAFTGEEWAIERVMTVLKLTVDGSADTVSKLNVIRSTDTTRPDGGIARKFEI